jgi:hypothetical protein
MCVSLHVDLSHAGRAEFEVCYREANLTVFE